MKELVLRLSSLVYDDDYDDCIMHQCRHGRSTQCAALCTQHYDAAAVGSHYNCRL